MRHDGRNGQVTESVCMKWRTRKKWAYKINFGG